MYSQSTRKKALEMLALTGDFEKSARMSGISGRTLRRWAANAAGPQQRTCGAKFEPYGDEVRGKAMEMARMPWREPPRTLWSTPPSARRSSRSPP